MHGEWWTGSSELEFTGLLVGAEVTFLGLSGFFGLSAFLGLRERSVRSGDAWRICCSQRLLISPTFDGLTSRARS